MERKPSIFTDSCSENDPSVQFHPTFNISNASSIPSEHTNQSYNFEALQDLQNPKPAKRVIQHQESDQGCQCTVY